MFEVGFLGTRSPLFMDILTLYFALVPFLVGSSIYFAVKRKLLWHIYSQNVIFMMTLVMVVFFEIGVRVDGGFNAYMQESSFSYEAVLVYLLIHILFAVVTMIAWGITIYSSYKAFRTEGIHTSYFKKHRKRARWVFLAIVLNSILGVSMYPILFMS